MGRFGRTRDRPPPGSHLFALYIGLSIDEMELGTRGRTGCVTARDRFDCTYNLTEAAEHEFQKQRERQAKLSKKNKTGYSLDL